METVIPHSEIKNHSSKKYRTILADPPWGVPSQRGRNSNRSAESHYELMPIDRIMAMPVQDLAEENSHLYLWIPNALLQEGLDVIKAWGFTFRSPLYWIKPRLLLGNYFRNASETSSISSTRIMICFIKRYRLHRSGCAIVKKWMHISWNG